MATSSTVMMPTATTGATAMRTTAMVYLTDDHLADRVGMEERAAESGLDTIALADQLSAFLAHERCGVHLYRSAAGRTRRDDLRAKYEEFGEETREHVDIYTELIRAFGGDPQFVSAAARATEKGNGALLESTFLLDGSLDPVARELAILDAVAAAEAKCHANWALLGRLAESVQTGEVRRAMTDAVERVQPQEDEHLEWVTSTREMLLRATLLIDEDLPADGLRRQGEP